MSRAGRLQLKRALQAAKAHGEDSDPEMECGDLLTVIHALYNLLTADQRELFARNDEVRELIETWGTP